MILTTIDYILTAIAVWAFAFLFHELMHPKSQGIFNTGEIHVHPVGLTVSSDNIWNQRLCRMGGGILTSILCFILFFCSQDIQFQYAFFTMGWIQFAYGLYEGWIGCSGRYWVYGIVGLVCTLFWFGVI